MKDLAIVTMLVALAAYYLNLVQGWELLMFSVLTFLLLGFHVYFIRYVDAQKAFKPSGTVHNDLEED